MKGVSPVAFYPISSTLLSPHSVSFRLPSQKDVHKPLTCPHPSLSHPTSLPSPHSSLLFPEPWCSIPIGADGSAMVHAFPLQNTKQSKKGGEKRSAVSKKKKKMTCGTGRHGWIDMTQHGGGGGWEKGKCTRELKNWTRPLKKPMWIKHQSIFAQFHREVMFSSARRQKHTEVYRGEDNGDGCLNIVSKTSDGRAEPYCPNTCNSSSRPTGQSRSVKLWLWLVMDIFENV